VKSLNDTDFTGYLFRLSDAIIKSFHIQTYEEGNVKLLKAITEPFTKFIIKVCRLWTIFL